jgi:tetratricopeptide (TPR) repeat protein
METASAKIIQHPANVQGKEPSIREDSAAEHSLETQEAAAIGHQPVSKPVAEGSPPDFLSALAELGVKEERVRAERTRLLGEISVLRTENRWEDILALFHPVEEKVPELAALGLAAPVRAEAAFALGHLGRHDEAIDLYTRCLAEEPENFYYHSGLAYAAYDTLYAAKGRQLMLHPAERKARIDLAHRHFAMAQSLRPERVTNYYRQGMLFKKIQGKPAEAVPLFETAVRNWEAYSQEDKKARHQERKNYVKALYQLASCHLDAQKPALALDVLTRCLREDEEPAYFSTVHKYFALGKVHFERGDLVQAHHALNFAAAQANPEDDDYVFELLARVQLCRGDTEKAWEAVNRVPFKRRRPYFRWTEAEVLTARGEWERARKVLTEAAERDRRGRHKALIRLARIEFRLGRYDQCLHAAEEADRFFRNQYQNPCGDALLWQAAALLRLGRLDQARDAAGRLGECMPHHPHLGKLRRLLDEAST